MTEKEIYIENVGLFYEKYGLPKMAGRILGYLISSSTENSSFEDFTTALKASKGSISSNVNLLLSQKLIEKTMVTGNRKSYYKIATDSLNNIISAKVDSIKQFKEILATGLELNPHENGPINKELTSIRSYYEFLEREIPLLKQKWDDLNKNNEKIVA